MGRAWDTTASDTALSILIVDDDPVNQKTTSATVRSLGHHFELAQNGQEAVDAVERRRFDVVLMDLHMPVMDGITAILEIRSRLPADERPAVIGTTSSDVVDDVRRCLDAGMVEHLPKPIDRQRLADVLKVIRTSIARRRKGMDNRIKVLLVDDDPIITAVYKRHLQQAGFAAEIANDSIEGFVKLQVFKPNVVLLDLKMPYRSGAEWLSEIRNMPKHARLPVIIVTDLPMDSPDVKLAIESGAVQVLAKGKLSPDAVIAAVSWALNPAGQGADAPSRGPDRRR